MTSVSPFMFTSVSLSTSIATSFSTIYQTSQPVSLTTLTSIASQFTTLISTATISRPEVVLTSTLEVLVTAVNTFSQILTSTPISTMATPTWSTSPAPYPTIEIVTSTLVSTVTQPGETITYRPSVLPVITSTATIAESTPSAATITFTQVDFIFENADGSAYKTMTTILPADPRETQDIILINTTGDHGWNSWSHAEQGGLIAGVVVGALLIVGFIIWCLMRRRRRIWVNSGWYGRPSGHVVVAPPMQRAQRAYWGPGPHGWGLRGGSGGD